MVQNVTWEWLLEGFKFDLETEVKPKTVEYYCDHARVFIRWIQEQTQTGISDPHVLTKRDVQTFLHHLTEGPARVVARNGAVRLVKRTATTRWHYY
ncbi:MAG: phage integrase N-terminal SAM-like domain-containing protein, partial [Chloroflexi bacterium]|nr:phage integrase N-terminal SAM-like domain-containing protein [Chloroflexota bacterium]